MSWITLITIATLVGSALICHNIALARGAKPVSWGVLGFIFGPLAIPFVFMTKNNKPN